MKCALPVLALCLVSGVASAKKIEKHPLPPKFGEGFSEAFAWCEVGGPPGDCLCFEPLACGPTGCHSYDEELQELERVLKENKKEFTCKDAEILSCGPIRYIWCDQGKAGARLAAYDEKGKLRSLRQRSGTVKYCQNKAFISYQGEVAACKPLIRLKKLKGQAKVPPAPAEDYPFAKK